MKKRITGLLIVMTIAASAYSGEWDYVPDVELRYMNNLNEEAFHAVVPNVIGTIGISDGTVRLISKIPKEVKQAMHRGLNSYDLDIGDTFIFSCGYSWTTPKAIIVILRITKINKDGTYSYEFYATQFQ
ncbi:MAG: hypothetical protein LBC27_00495 [Spirochaetaceae bacterium]|jgi:hypothetical protein|nr:hypothetical protein [Spirochaetaceae bacterium]